MKNVYPIQIKYDDCIQDARVNLKTETIIFNNPRIVNYILKKEAKEKIQQRFQQVLEEEINKMIKELLY